MPSSLDLTYDELRAQLAYSGGFAPDKSAWSDEIRSLLESSIRSGLRRFLYGTVVSGSVYDWSFLRKHHDFTTVSDVGDYELPADFGSPVGPIYFTQEQFSVVPFVNESRMQLLRSLATLASGTPCYAATRFKPTGAVPQVQELMLHPDPSGEYSMRLIYRVGGEMLSAANQYPPGGAEHSRTVLYACLAEMAKRRNLPEAAQYEMDFQQSLLASISVDNRTRGPMGMNVGDEDMMPERMRTQHIPLITVDSVLYDNVT